MQSCRTNFFYSIKIHQYYKRSERLRFKVLLNCRSSKFLIGYVWEDGLTSDGKGKRRIGMNGDAL